MIGQAMPGSEPELRLTGGFVNRVVRVGKTVRRPAGPWSRAIHALLRHLEKVGFEYAPRVLGTDDQGREILSFIPGEAIGWSDWPSHLRQDAGVQELGSVLRRYHDAVVGFTPDLDAVWRNPLAPARGELICHGDFSPFNTIWRGGHLVGVIDWDFAQPGNRVSDLAYLAWYTVPLAGDRRTREYGFDPVPDRSHRLDVLVAAYGLYTPAEVVEEAVRIIELERHQTAQLAETGLEPWSSFARHGNLEVFADEAEWIRRNRRPLLG
jgi:Phosphotransferase enzyme family